jgi:hypothetical protein
MTAGGTFDINVLAGPGAITGVAFGFGATPNGVVIPGIACSFDLQNVLPFSVSFIGTTSVTVPIPPDPGLVGTVLYMQGVNTAAATFTNVACVHVYM